MKHTVSNKRRLQSLATAGVLTAVAMILSWVEFLLPFSIGVPGVKLGLCHVVTLFALYALSAWETVAITVVRIFLTAALFGNVNTLAYSLAGGLLSLLVMLLLRRLKWKGNPIFSPMGVSVAGAVTHNIGQLCAAALILQTAGVLSYLPVLLVSGIVTGTIVGTLSGAVYARAPKKL